MGFDLASLLRQHKGAGTSAPDKAADDFQQAAQPAPTDLIGQGLAAVFRSDQTPPFGQMAAQWFGQAPPAEQAGMLNRLFAGMGPAVLASLLHGAGGAGLGGLLGQLTDGGAKPTLTPAQASILTPEQVQVIADHAEQHDPDIIDPMSGFFAEHPALLKLLGSAVLGIALAKMAEHARA